MEIGCCYAITPTWPKFAWIADACERLGHKVVRAHKADQFPSVQHCDIILLSQKSIAGRWPNLKHHLAECEKPLVYWWFDLVATQRNVPLCGQPLFKQFERMFRRCDISLIKERSLLNDYRELGIPAYYCDQGCPSDYPAVHDAEIKWDLLVWGQGGPAYKERVSAARLAEKRGFKVGWACQTHGGIGEPLPWTHPDELAELSSQARCVLSCGSRNDLDGYWSDQFWMACGMGACVLRKWTPGLPDGPYLVWETNEHLCELLRWAKSNPEETRETGRSTREWVMNNHTIEHRLRDVFRVVKSVAEKATSS